MSDDHNFLARWSRRKRQAQGQDVPPDPPAQAPGDIAAEPAAAADAELTPEELARLPAPDTLTAETDMMQFLRKGVPEALRKAALRRVWALDPAVRDYVGDARDYSGDWNTPGSMPGFGPLLPSEGVKQAIADVSGVSGPRSHAEVMRQASALPAEPTRGTAPAPSPSAAAPFPQEEAEVAGEPPAPEAAEPEATASVPALPAPDAARRHGGATPV